MSIRVDANLVVRIIETLEGPFVDPQDPSFSTGQLRLVDSFTSATTVPVTKYAAYELTLSSGTGSVNLAALPGKTAEEILVGTGLKLQILILKNKTTNANKISISKGASNGYGTCASGDTWTRTLSPGQMDWYYMAEAAPDIASGARLLDCVGTGSQVLQLIAVLG